MNLPDCLSLMRSRGADLLVSLSLLALAFYVQSASGRFSELGAIFPRAVALMIAVLGVALLLYALLPTDFLRNRRSSESASGNPATVPILHDDSATTSPTLPEATAIDEDVQAYDATESNSALPAYVVIAGLVVWVALLPRLGFVLTSTVGLLVFSLAILDRTRWTHRNLITLVSFSIFTPSLVHYVMKEFLLVPLP
jgi:hypothetical protein